MGLRRLTVPFLLATFGALLLVYAGMQDMAFTDYDAEAAPSFDALRAGESLRAMIVRVESICSRVMSGIGSGSAPGWSPAASTSRWAPSSRLPRWFRPW